MGDTFLYACAPLMGTHPFHGCTYFWEHIPFLCEEKPLHVCNPLMGTHSFMHVSPYLWGHIPFMALPASGNTSPSWMHPSGKHPLWIINAATVPCQSLLQEGSTTAACIMIHWVTQHRSHTHSWHWNALHGVSDTHNALLILWKISFILLPIKMEIKEGWKEELT